MKKLLILTLLPLATIAQKRDTISLPIPAAAGIHDNVLKAIWKIDGNPRLTNGERNSLDSLLGPVYQYLDVKLKSDTGKNIPKKGGKK